MTEVVDAAELGRWISDRASGARRFLFGLAGAPGSGKSTLAARLHDELGAAIVPMDGFHLPDAVLNERGLRSVKGAPHTFDAIGFVDAVRRLRDGHDVLLPTFDRVTDEPVPDSLHVGPDESIVIVEGNYLLLDQSPWNHLPALFDVIGHLTIDPSIRVARLVDRHVLHGKQPNEARRFVEMSDEANAALVEAAADRADLVIVGG